MSMSTRQLTKRAKIITLNVICNEIRFAYTKLHTFHVFPWQNHHFHLAFSHYLGSTGAVGGEINWATNLHFTCFAGANCDGVYNGFKWVWHMFSSCSRFIHPNVACRARVKHATENVLYNMFLWQFPYASMDLLGSMHLSLTPSLSLPPLFFIASLRCFAMV